MIAVFAKVAAFQGPALEHRAIVHADGAVGVWDVIQREYTTDHGLTDADQDRVRRLVDLEYARIRAEHGRICRALGA